MARPVRMLVVAHDASRTGAPLVLLTFLRWVRDHTDVDIELVLWRGGPLVEPLAEVVDQITVLHPPPGRRSAPELVEDALAKVGFERVGARLRSARVRRRLDPAPHDARWLNGAGSALVLSHLAGEAPSVAHVHELERGLTHSLHPPGREAFLSAARVVAVSQAVADVLVSEWGVDPERIVVVPGSLPVRPPITTADPPIEVPEGARLVLSVGTGGWRKGIDRFLELAVRLRARIDDIHLAWVGALDTAAIRSEVDRLRLADVVTLAGAVGDPSPWYERADVFVSTAREDPFPLVAVEAGAAGLPVVAFDSGGIRELLADGRGTVVGPGDVAAMADRVAAVLAHGDGGAGERLAAHVARHHRPDVMGEALWREVDGLTRRR